MSIWIMLSLVIGSPPLIPSEMVDVLPGMKEVRPSDPAWISAAERAIENTVTRHINDIIGQQKIPLDDDQKNELNTLTTRAVQAKISKIKKANKAQWTDMYYELIRESTTPRMAEAIMDSWLGLEPLAPVPVGATEIVKQIQQKKRNKLFRVNNVSITEEVGSIGTKNNNIDRAEWINLSVNLKNGTGFPIFSSSFDLESSGCVWVEKFRFFVMEEMDPDGEGLMNFWFFVPKECKSSSEIRINIHDTHRGQPVGSVALQVTPSLYEPPQISKLNFDTDYLGFSDGVKSQDIKPDQRFELSADLLVDEMNPLSVSSSWSVPIWLRPFFLTLRFRDRTLLKHRAGVYLAGDDLDAETVTEAAWSVESASSAAQTWLVRPAQGRVWFALDTEVQLPASSASKSGTPAAAPTGQSSAADLEGAPQQGSQSSARTRVVLGAPPQGARRRTSRKVRQRQESVEPERRRVVASSAGEVASSRAGDAGNAEVSAQVGVVPSTSDIATLARQFMRLVPRQVDTADSEGVQAVSGYELIFDQDAFEAAYARQFLMAPSAVTPPEDLPPPTVPPLTVSYRSRRYVSFPAMRASPRLARKSLPSTAPPKRVARVRPSTPPPKAEPWLHVDGALGVSNYRTRGTERLPAIWNNSLSWSPTAQLRAMLGSQMLFVGTVTYAANFGRWDSFTGIFFHEFSSKVGIGYRLAWRNASISPYAIGGLSFRRFTPTSSDDIGVIGEFGLRGRADVADSWGLTLDLSVPVGDETLSGVVGGIGVRSLVGISWQY